MTDFGYGEPEVLAPFETRGAGTQRIVNAAGAAVSLGLVAGMCVWGYQLLVRDVSGVPVIEALDQAYRVAPEDPGGQIARHQGLQVNEIAAVGTAGGPANEVVLAPGAEPLSEEDWAWGELVAAAEEEARRSGERVTVEEVAPPALDERLADGGALAIDETDLAMLEDETRFAPDDALSGFEPMAEEPAAPQASAVDAAIAEAMMGVMDEPAPETRSAGVSLRPRARPASGVGRISGVTAVRGALTPREPGRPLFAGAETSFDGLGETAPMAAEDTTEIEVGSLPQGARLVQLGAFNTPDAAREGWARLATRFPEAFAAKRRVIEESVSGGRSFYRLRAEGFAGVDEARRFCSVLLAERADCIPVEVQ